MGFLGIDSTSSNKVEAQDNRIAVTDSGLAQRGTGNQLAKDQAKVIKQTGKAVTATDKAKVTYLGDNANTGLKFGNIAAGANIVIGDGGASASALADTLKTVSAGTQSAVESLQQSLTAQGSTVRDALDKVTSLSESKQTDGASSAGKTLIWLVLGGLGFLALVFYFLKR